MDPTIVSLADENQTTDSQKISTSAQTEKKSKSKSKAQGQLLESTSPPPKEISHENKIGHHQVKKAQQNKFKLARKMKKLENERIIDLIKQEGNEYIYFVGSERPFRNNNIYQYVLRRDEIVDAKTWSHIYSTNIVKMFEPIVTRASSYVWNGTVLIMSKDEWIANRPIQMSSMKNPYEKWNLIKSMSHVVYFAWDSFLKQFEFEGIPLVVTNSSIPKKDMMIFHPVNIKWNQLEDYPFDKFNKIINSTGKYFVQYPSLKFKNIYQVEDVLDKMEQQVIDRRVADFEAITKLDNSALMHVFKSWLHAARNNRSSLDKKVCELAFKFLVESGSLPKTTPLTFAVLAYIFDLDDKPERMSEFWRQLMTINGVYDLIIQADSPSSTIYKAINNVSVATLNSKLIEDATFKDTIVGTKLNKQDVNTIGMFSDGFERPPEGIIRDIKITTTNFDIVRKSINVAWAFRGVLIVGGLKGTGKSALASMLKKTLPPNHVIDSDDFFRCEGMKKLTGGMTLYAYLSQLYPSYKDKEGYYKARSYVQKMLRSPDYRDMMVDYVKEYFGGIDSPWNKRAIFVHTMEEAEYLCTVLAPYIPKVKNAQSIVLRPFQLPAKVFSYNKDSHIDLMLNDVFSASMTSVEIYSLRDINNGILLGNLVDYPVSKSEADSNFEEQE